MAHQDVELATPSAVECSKSTLEVECSKVRCKYLKARLDLAIIKLIYAAAIPPTLVDYVEWKEIFLIANKAYRPSSGTLIANKHIPGEAARVQILSIEFLKTRFNLTISYDGGTMKQPVKIVLLGYRIQRALASARTLCPFPEYCPVFQGYRDNMSRGPDI
jgi:hypothetical protein